MNESVHETIAANIRALRTARGWSVKRLAEECAKRSAESLTNASLGNIERGNQPGSRPGRAVSVAELVFLAELFEVTPNDLFTAPVMETCDRCGGTGLMPVVKGGAR